MYFYALSVNMKWAIHYVNISWNLTQAQWRIPRLSRIRPAILWARQNASRWKEHLKMMSSEPDASREETSSWKQIANEVHKRCRALTRDSSLETEMTATLGDSRLSKTRRRKTISLARGTLGKKIGDPVCNESIFEMPKHTKANAPSINSREHVSSLEARMQWLSLSLWASHKTLYLFSTEAKRDRRHSQCVSKSFSDMLLQKSCFLSDADKRNRNTYNNDDNFFRRVEICIFCKRWKIIAYKGPLLPEFAPLRCWFLRAFASFAKIMTTITIEAKVACLRMNRNSFQMF